MSEKWYEAPEFHVAEPAIPDGSYDPFDYGAHGDGVAIDTAPLQACVDAAHRGGGGAWCCGREPFSPVRFGSRAG